jgi:hypothetical protein
VDGHIGKDFAVQFNLSKLQAVHEFAVGQPLRPDSGVDSGDPKPAKLAFTDLSIPVGIAQAFFNGFSGFPVGTASDAPVTGGQFKYLFSSVSCNGSIHCAGHSLSPVFGVWLVGKHDFHASRVPWGHGRGFSQISFSLGGLGRQNMATVGFIADDFSRTGLPKPLGGTFVGFHFWHRFLSKYSVQFIFCWSFDSLALLFRVGSQNHDQRTPFLLGGGFDHRDFFCVGDDPFENFEAVFPMDYFPAFKKYHDLGLVSRFDETGDMLQLEVIIVLVGVGTKLDLFEVNHLLVLFGFVRFLALLVFEFAKIHDPANGRIGRRGHFHKVKVIFLSHIDGVLSEENSHLFAVIADHGYFLDPYHFIGALLLSFN